MNITNMVIVIVFFYLPQFIVAGVQATQREESFEEQVKALSSQLKEVNTHTKRRLYLHQFVSIE